jgi:uncharacterized membrane protein
MKKKILYLALLLVAILPVTQAQQANILLMPDVQSGAGREAAIAVQMNNTSEVVAVQFEMIFPKGFRLSDTTSIRLADRKTNHTISARNLGNSRYLFVIYSPTNDVLMGNSGNLASIAVIVPDTCSPGILHAFDFDNIIISDKTGENVVTGSQAGQLEVIITPRPDVAVQQTTISSASISPGDQLTISWQVTNIGDLETSGGWSEQVSLVAPNGESTHLGTVFYSGLLAPGAIVSRQANFTLTTYPGVDGEVRAQVRLIPQRSLGELPSAASNNIQLSGNAATINKRLTLIQNRTHIPENDKGYVQYQLLRSGSRAEAQRFAISTNKPDRLEIPDSVQIPRGHSGAVFYARPIDNDIMNMDSVVTVSVSGNDYDVIHGTLIIVDNEVPGLTLTPSRFEVTEGDTFTLKIKRQLVTNQELSVNLQTNYPRRFNFQREVKIPANESEVELSVSVVDDKIPDLTVTAQFTASAHAYQTARCDLIVNDDDVPIIHLSIAPDTVSESAGIQAAIGKIMREGPTDQILYVRLSDNAAGQLYYNTPTITLNRGQSEARFTIGVVDNAEVDGDKEVEITAAVFITHCNCTVTPDRLGYVQTKLTITDDDGPSLKLTSSQSMLPEGKEAATILTVSRNTPPIDDLTVSISSNRDEKLVYNKTILIPSGQSSASVTVDVLSNDISEGDQLVSFTASTAGYSNGSCWAMISDQTLADAQIAIESLSHETIETKGTLRVNLRINNTGSAPLTYGKEVDIFISETNRLTTPRHEIASTFTRRDIAPGASDTVSIQLVLPDMTGTRYLFAEINATQQQKELSYLNNLSEAVGIQLTPAYQVSLFTDKTIYKTNDTIFISGTAYRGSGEGISEGEVEIYLASANGQRSSFVTKTDTEGNYSYNYLPSVNTVGRYAIGACYPGEGATKGAITIDILGLRRSSSAFIVWELLTNELYEGEIDIVNPGVSTLTNLVTNPEIQIDGLNIEFDPIPSLGAGASTKIRYRLMSTKPSLKNDYERVHFTTRSTEGASLRMTGHYVSQNPRASLRASISSINTTMTKGTVRTYDLPITNTGKGDSGPITVALPSTSWLSLVSPSTIPSLKSGESTTIVLQFKPGNDLALNVPVTGTFGVNCTNGTGLSMPFRIEPVSESTGHLIVDVCNEFTYYTEEAPHVEGARVSIRHPHTKAIIVEGVTNKDGLFKLEDLPEGFYHIHVTADNHDSYSNNILIDPGKTNTLVVNLSFQAITYSWEVVETEVEDVYEMETIVKFQTNVPIPIVEMISPKEIDTEKLSIGESLVFNVILTNKGLITARDVEVVVPRGMQSFTFEPLINMIDLRPQESVMIPVTVTKLANPSNAPAKARAAKDNCKEYIAVIYLWDCGNDRKWHQFAKEISLGTWCTTRSTPTPPSNWSGYSLTFGGWGDWGGSYTGSATQSNPTVNVSDCEPCVNSFRYKMAKCFIKRIPIVAEVLAVVEVLECIYEVTSNGDLSCAVKKLVTKNVWIDKILGYTDLYDDCLKPILEPCVPGSFAPNAPGGTARTQQQMPAYIAHFQDVMEQVYLMANSHEEQLFEIFGDSIWMQLTGEAINDFWDKLMEYNGLIPTDATLIQFLPDGISEAHYHLFIERWNNSMNPAYTGINRIDYDNFNRLLALQRAAKEYAAQLGYESVLEMFEKEYAIYEKEANDNAGSVCATITLKFSQTMTMTRQAFRGTLTVFNGHESIPMQDVELDLVVKDEDGTIATSFEFQINTEKLDKLSAIDGTGTLDAQQTGVATILFIPTKHAAPEYQRDYSFGGTLSYTDPFTGSRVTRELFPVILTVKPSPDLVLRYFMQRDVLGDDPMTTDLVEPSVDAEFTLLIHNEGAGEATNVRISSKQPEIIDNEKGLLIDFKIVSSNLNGQEKNIGVTNIDFGNIPAGGSAYGQWWFRSSLLGHFVEYDTKITHVTSYGNPDLSLVKSLDIHELISSIEINRNGQKLRGFMANDVVDTHDLPDMMYVSDGTNSEISTLNEVQLKETGSYQQRLTIAPSQKGWNYALLADPYNGRAQLMSVVREANNTPLPVANFRQTHVTLRDGKEPVYENKLHFIDEVELSGGSYLLTFEPKRENVLQVMEFGNVPSTVARNQVKQLEVTFNRAILDSTFNYKDIRLNCQGIELDVSKVTISKLNALTYRLHLDSVTNTNGHFVLTVHSSAINDEEGYPGDIGKSTSWTQFLDEAVQVFVQIVPEEAGTVNPQTGIYNYGEPIIFRATARSGYQFKHWIKDGVVIATTAELAHVPLETKIIQSHFELKKYMVTLSFDTKMGILTGNNTGIYNHGSKLFVTAMPLEGYEFKGWMLNGVLEETNENQLSVEVYGDMNIMPVFKQKDPPTALETIEAGRMTIFPNPANSNSQVQLVLPLENAELTYSRIRIMSLTGHCIQEIIPKQAKIELTNLDVGMYMIQLLTPGKHHAVVKLIIR